MGDLKSGWRRVKFGDVVRQVKDRIEPQTAGIDRYVAGEHMDTDDLRIRRWGDLGDGYLGPAFHMRFCPGHVLYGSRRTYLRKVAVADFEGICANTTFVLQSSDPNVLLPGLLPFVMQTEAFHEHSRRESKGSVNPYVNFSDLAWYEFVLPSLREQHRMLAMLDAANRAVVEYDDLVSACSTLRRSHTKRLFVTSPEGERRVVGDCAAVRNGTTPRRNVAEYWGGDIAWLPTGKVNERRIRSADEFITKKALDECSLGGVIPAGATLVAMIGEGVTRGKVARLEIEACINQNFAAVIPSPAVDGSFLFYYLESHYESLRRWSHGTNQQALNCSLVRSFPIYLPSINRQIEIASVVRGIDTASEVALERRRQAKTQFRTLLSHAFSRGN